MIIPQGWPMWVEVDRGRGNVTVEAIVAWWYEDGRAPLPITGRSGRLNPERAGVFYTSHDDVYQRLRGLEQERIELAEREKDADIRREMEQPFLPPEAYGGGGND